eukprot:COSAG06_NODE_412_length_16042_cov_52.419934_9_plen_198_part_00
MSAAAACVAPPLLSCTFYTAIAQCGEQGHVELGSMLMGRDDAEGAAHHFDVAFRSARSLPVRCLAALPCRLALPCCVGLLSVCLAAVLAAACASAPAAQHRCTAPIHTLVRTVGRSWRWPRAQRSWLQHSSASPPCLSCRSVKLRKGCSLHSQRSSLCRCKVAVQVVLVACIEGGEAHDSGVGPHKARCTAWRGVRG